MKRPVMLTTGQWSDLGLAGLCDTAASMGYDGLELALRPSLLSLDKAATSRPYCEEVLEAMGSKGLRCWALSSHAIEKCVADLPDPRLDDRPGLCPFRRILAADTGRIPFGRGQPGPRTPSIGNRLRLLLHGTSSP